MGSQTLLSLSPNEKVIITKPGAVLFVEKTVYGSGDFINLPLHAVITHIGNVGTGLYRHNAFEWHDPSTHQTHQGSFHFSKTHPSLVIDRNAYYTPDALPFIPCKHASKKLQQLCFR